MWIKEEFRLLIGYSLRLGYWLDDENMTDFYQLIANAIPVPLILFISTAFLLAVGRMANFVLSSVQTAQERHLYICRGPFN